MIRNILIGFSIIGLIWIYYPIVHLTKVKWSENRIEYTGKSIENEYSHPTKNVKNESDDCINERKLSPGEKDTKCK